MSGDNWCLHDEPTDYKTSDSDAEFATRELERRIDVLEQEVQQLRATVNLIKKR